MTKSIHTQYPTCAATEPHTWTRTEKNKKKLIPSSICVVVEHLIFWSILLQINRTKPDEKKPRYQWILNKKKCATKMLWWIGGYDQLQKKTHTQKWF